MSPHGTNARYTSHGCRCLECVTARSVYMRSYRASHPDVIVRQQVQERHRERALSRLRAAHSKEYQRLLGEERHR